MTIIALTCLLVVGAAATTILGRDSVPAAPLEMASPVVKGPVSDRESEEDRLAVGAAAPAGRRPGGKWPRRSSKARSRTGKARRTGWRSPRLRWLRSSHDRQKA